MPTNNTVSEDTSADIARRYRGGESARAIAESLGYQTATVYYHLRRRGVPVRGKHVKVGSPPIAPRVTRHAGAVPAVEIIRLHGLGRTQSEIGALLRVPYGAIAEVLERWQTRPDPA